MAASKPGRSWPDSLKKTKQRLAVFEALLEADKPVGARELSAILERRGEPLWYSTIYRALESLLLHGVVQKTAVLDGGAALYELGEAHRHYAVCLGCSRAIPLKSCPLEHDLPELDDFHVVGHRLQVSGYCGECYQQKE